jgi:P pilus assembly chaperone PapD
MKQVSKVDKELKQELEWINENLKAAVTNQYALYMELKEVVKELSGKKIDSP